MASVIIYADAVPSNSGWSFSGSASPIVAMQDGDPTTLYYNYPANFGTSIDVFLSKTGGAPGDFAGSTITAVEIWVAMDPPTSAYGTFHWLTWRSGVGTLASSSVASPFSPAYRNVTSQRPGGGSWVASDFFTADTWWGVRSNRDADTAARQTNLTECWMRVTYTPVSPPVAAFTVSTTTGTSPLTVNFTDQSTNSPTSWLWSFGDTNTSSTQNPSHVYSSTATSTYTVTLTATNAGGSDDEVKTSLLAVDPAEAAVAAAFIGNPVSGVQNLGVQFNDQSTGTPAPSIWSWAFGDGDTSTAQNPLHVYTTVGTFTVTLTVENTTPTTATETKNSYISVANGKPIPAAVANTGEGQRPLLVQFTGSATNAFPTNWLWDFGDGSSSVAQSPAHVYNTVGAFAPVLSVSNQVGVATTPAIAIITVGTVSTTTNIILVDYVVVTASGTVAATMGYLPLTARFKDLSTGDAFSWQWQFGEFTTSTSQHPVKTYLSTDDNGVALTVTEKAASEFAGSTDPTAVNEDTLTLTNVMCLLEPDNSWGYFFEELKYQMMEPLHLENLCSGFESYGGLAKVLELTHQRLARFVLETACLRKEATLSAATAGTEDFPLPSDLIELLRVEVAAVPYYPTDPHQRDFGESNNVYFQKDTLEITIPGTFGTTPVVKALYTFLPTAPSIPNPCDCPSPQSYSFWAFFPLPYVLWWIIRYGVMADLLNQAGERNDPQRAGKCEQMYTFGTQLYKFLYRGGSGG